MPDDQTWVRAEVGAAGLAARITARGHTLAADEPLDFGGADSGPTPYELLDAALAACTAMTVRFYAGRHGIPLAGVSAAVAHGRIHAKDCADCDTKDANAYIHRMQVRLTLDGDLSSEQREALLSAANRCPVHRTLTGEVRVEVELAG